MIDPNGSSQHRIQYCVITMRYKFLSSEMNIKLDFGENESLLKQFGTDIIQQTEKVMTVTNQVDALNYMAYLGWEVVNLAPFETDGDGGTLQTYKYLMKRSF